MNDWQGITNNSQHTLTTVQPSYFKDLNPQQLQAVKTLQGPVLILAGAGTGKTRTLTSRIAYLIDSGQASRHQILAVTFTNKAANEMKIRVENLLNDIYPMPWVGTFHILCLKILRKHCDLVGLTSGFTILDKDDQLRILKQLIEASNIDTKYWPPRDLAFYINKWKNDAIMPQTVPSTDKNLFNKVAVKLYYQYQERLKNLNACDFDDLIMHVIYIFKKHTDILEFYQKRLRYILVDEYQDTNIAQYIWLRLLAVGYENICCVGDDDQSIYGWRGAQVKNILYFENNFKNTTVIRLEQNYRSTEHILKAASSVIAHNRERLKKTLWTAQKGGEKLRVTNYDDDQQEAQEISQDIENFQRGNGDFNAISLDKIAILVRASHQMRAFEDRFINIGLPYQVIGGPRFYERLEIRDAIAYLRIIINFRDGLAFERIINKPPRKIGTKRQQIINKIARGYNISLFAAAQKAIKIKAIPQQARNELSKLIKVIKYCSDMLRNTPNKHVEVAEIILDESGYTQFWKNSKLADAPGRLDNLEELIGALEYFENMPRFLEHIALVMDNNPQDGAKKLSIMTIHAAKGLEFPVVFLPGWEEDIFPSKRTLDDEGKKGLEEERRLAYVSITRACTQCRISFCNNRLLHGRRLDADSSRFIDELPPQSIEVSACSKPRKAHVSRSDFGQCKLNACESIIVQQEDKVIAKRFNPLDRVYHQTLGSGTIIKINHNKLLIHFDKGGNKTVLENFVNPIDEIPF